MFLDKLVGGLTGMCGIGGGGEEQTQGTKAAKGNSFDQIGDSFKNGDTMGGIQGILGMVTGMGGGGGGMNITEMMDPMMFMDPLTKMVFEEVGKQGYANQSPTGGNPPAPTGASTTGGQPTANACAAYEAKFASAAQEIKDHFDLLDTASGIGGKDGLIGRCDLEAALKNTALPTELKNACYFLLSNPAAFNQLDVGAGIGKCDGLIGKCDVDAALAGRLQQAEPPAKPKNEKLEETKKKENEPGRNEIRNEKTDATAQPDGAKADGAKGGTDKAGAKGESGPVQTGKEDDGSDTKVTTKPVTNPFEGMEAEEIIDSLVHSLDSKMEEIANQLATETNQRKIDELELEMQTVMARRKQMFDLLSNMLKVEHDMATTAIGNLGRI